MESPTRIPVPNDQLAKVATYLSEAAGLRRLIFMTEDVGKGIKELKAI